MTKVSNTEGLKIDGQSWVKLSIDNCPVNVEFARLVIERKGEKEPFLSEHGWQASEDSSARLSVKIEQVTASSFTLLLNPKIVRHLEKSNYTFHLHTESSSPIVKFVYNWRGIVYIPAPSQPLEEPVPVVNPTPDPWPHLVGSDPPLDPWANPNVEVPIQEVTAKDPPKENLTFEPLDEPTVVTCLNPSCRQQIFRRYKKCPFCQVSRF